MKKKQRKNLKGKGTRCLLPKAQELSIGWLHEWCNYKKDCEGYSNRGRILYKITKIIRRITFIW